jgi:3-phenylpropionate/cinnamic acid dioxygenase small subunit
MRSDPRCLLMPCDPSAEMRLHHEVMQFYAAEADLLDERRFEEWLALLTDDVRYYMPIIRDVRCGEPGGRTRERQDANWFDEGKETLRQRVAQLATGIHWAEEPQSRTSHLITNLRILSAEPDGPHPAQLATKCRFLLYRNRLQDEEDILVGKRQDILRRAEAGWMIARREIILDQNVLLAKNLTSFF